MRAACWHNRCPMKKYHIATLGCRTNQYESQLFSDQLRRMGYEPAPEDEADLCIINTCSVTDSAEASSRRQIRNLARRHPNARLIVTGCMAESSQKAILAIDPRIEVFPNKDKEQLVSFLFPEEKNRTGLSIERFDGHTRAFVKVQDGCNSFCSYCIIPYVRGRSRSRSVAEIIQEVRTLTANGYREIVLTGVNVGDYAADGASLADLVRAVDRVKGIQRVRISSIDPTDVNEDLAGAILNGLHTCPNLHLVLQSGSNVVLKRMNRKYSRQIFLKTVEGLVNKNKDFTFTTDVIVGFPNESEADFAETLDVVRQVRFAKVHVFPYSVRSRTRAALDPHPVPQDVIAQRKEELLRLADQVAFDLRQQYLHRTMDVLLEEGKGDVLSGHTSNFITVEVPRGSHGPNQLVQVEMLENSPDGIKGRIL
ncbi:MAG: 2-methylthioadenine synthetase [Parachlamydiales bacterium]|nr:2-methylthioadenine synthetase [Parachlamydiales bacterium]